MAPAVRLCFAKTICLFSMIFLSIGPVALFYLGLTYVSQYRTTSHYVRTVCDVSNVTSYTLCRKDCVNQSTSCRPSDVCFGVGNVNYEKPQGGVVKGAILFESVAAMNTILRRKKQCHGKDCSEEEVEEEEEEEDEEEEDEGDDVGEKGSGRGPLSAPRAHQNDAAEESGRRTELLVADIHLLRNSSSEKITCYVSSDDTSHVLRHVPQARVVMHMMLWPSVIVMLGFSFCLVSKLCTREKC